MSQGLDADIVVSDLRTIREVGTYEDPSRPTIGVQSLIVSGVAVVEGGAMFDMFRAVKGRPRS